MSRATRSSKLLSTASDNKIESVMDEKHERSFELMQKIANHIRGAKSDGWEKASRILEIASSSGRESIEYRKYLRDEEIIEMIKEDRTESIREDRSYNLSHVLSSKRLTDDIFKDEDSRLSKIPRVEKLSVAILEESGIEIVDGVIDIFDDGEWMKVEKYKDFSDNLNSLGTITRMDYISNYMGLVKNKIDIYE